MAAYRCRSLLSSASVFGVASIGAATNGLLLASLFWRYAAYKSPFSATVTDESWWSMIGRPQNASDWIMFLVILSPVLLLLSIYLFMMAIAFQKNRGWFGAGIVGAIINTCLSVLGLVVSIIVNIIMAVLIFLQTLSFGSFAAPPAHPDYVTPFAVYGPAFWFVPTGFIITLLCGIVLQVLLIGKVTWWLPARQPAPVQILAAPPYYPLGAPYYEEPPIYP